jgi:hypothetical protein
MKTKSKMILILSVTLLIGMILGVLISGTLRHHHFRKTIHRMRTQEGLIYKIEKIVQPDETQKKVIKEILVKHSKSLHELHIFSRNKIESTMDSLKQEMKSILTTEQMDKFTRWLKDKKDIWEKGPGKFRKKYPHMKKRKFGKRDSLLDKPVE